jgi:putative ABC transport system substrate-binding protein
MSFAPDREEILKRVAYYVDRLLRGAKPADLPFEEASKFKLTVNLKSAKALGVEIPQSVLLRADEVIR